MTSTIFAAVIAVIHIYVFFLESVAWGKPETNKLFKVSAAEAQATRGFAFNQGFYNLFLVIAIVSGMYLIHQDHPLEGRTLIDYGALSVFFAGVVLLVSSRNLWRPALIQAGPALLYGICRFMGL